MFDGIFNGFTHGFLAFSEENLWGGKYRAFSAWKGGMNVVESGEAFEVKFFNLLVSLSLSNIEILSVIFPWHRHGSSILG